MKGFEVNDIVKIIRKNKELDMLFPNSFKKRAFRVGDMGRIIRIPNPYPNETRIRFNVVMLIQVYKSGGKGTYSCMGEEITLANKVGC
jgi:hypothetical protein